MSQSVADGSTSSYDVETPSELSESPAKSLRGRGGRRARASGRSSRSRSRSGSSGRGSRSRRGGRRADERESEEGRLQVLQDREDQMRAEVENMPQDELRRLCLSMVERHPALVFDILRPQQRQPGGYHPPPGGNVPDWCVCMKCREMPTAIERQCCGKERCISLLPNFRILVLDREVLAVARIFRRDVLVYQDEDDLNKADRHQAYRQFILLQHGKLGVGDRSHTFMLCLGHPRRVSGCIWTVQGVHPFPFRVNFVKENPVSCQFFLK